MSDPADSLGGTPTCIVERLNSCMLRCQTHAVTFVDENPPLSCSQSTWKAPIPDAAELRGEDGDGQHRRPGNRSRRIVMRCSVCGHDSGDGQLSHLCAGSAPLSNLPIAAPILEEREAEPTPDSARAVADVESFRLLPLNQRLGNIAFILAREGRWAYRDAICEAQSILRSAPPEQAPDAEIADIESFNRIVRGGGGGYSSDIIAKQSEHIALLLSRVRAPATILEKTE